MASVSIVISAYNEESSLEQVFERALGVLDRCVEDGEIVMVDDASTDSTGEIMERLAARYSGLVRVLRNERNMGIAYTFERAYRAGRKAFVFDVPGDGEYPPEVLERMVPLLDRYDIVVAERARKQYGPYRRLVSECYRWLPRILFGVDLRDPGSIKCRRREVIHEVVPESTGVFAEAERIIRAVRRGYRFGAVPIEPEPRKEGRGGGARPGLVLRATADMLSLWVKLRILRRPI